MGQTIMLKASDGHSLSAYRADPDGSPKGIIVIVQEIFGVNSHIRGVCDRYAAAGWLAVAPSIFDRVQPGLEFGYAPEDVERGRALKARIGVDTALPDVAAARAVAPTLPAGIVGYCWGGTIAWATATRLDGFDAAVCYYGGGIAELAEEQPRCPVMMHFGEHDAAIPMSDVDAIRKAHPEVPIHVYPAGHGFNCDQRGSYDPESAALAQRRTFDFLDQHVRSAP